MAWLPGTLISQAGSPISPHLISDRITYLHNPLLGYLLGSQVSVPVHASDLERTCVKASHISDATFDVRSGCVCIRSLTCRLARPTNLVRIFKATPVTITNCSPCQHADSISQSAGGLASCSSPAGSHLQQATVSSVDQAAVISKLSPRIAQPNFGCRCPVRSQRFAEAQTPISHVEVPAVFSYNFDILAEATTAVLP